MSASFVQGPPAVSRSASRGSQHLLSGFFRRGSFLRLTTIFWRREFVEFIVALRLLGGGRHFPDLDEAMHKVGGAFDAGFMVCQGILVRVLAPHALGDDLRLDVAGAACRAVMHE